MLNFESKGSDRFIGRRIDNRMNGWMVEWIVARTQMKQMKQKSSNEIRDTEYSKSKIQKPMQ
jgi:hypothetical protein